MQSDIPPDYSGAVNWMLFFNVFNEAYYNWMSLIDFCLSCLCQLWYFHFEINWDIFIASKYHYIQWKQIQKINLLYKFIFVCECVLYLAEMSSLILMCEILIKISHDSAILLYELWSYDVR